jgi:hypothetical protein
MPLPILRLLPKSTALKTQFTLTSSRDCPLLLLARLSAGPNEVVPFESSSTQAEELKLAGHRSPPSEHERRRWSPNAN